MRLTAITSYPVKGCHRVDHDGADVQLCGLVGDRRWAVVDARARCLTQRETPGLTLVHPTLRAEGGLTLRQAGRPDLDVPEPRGGERIDVRLWSTTISASLAGDAADGWLSTALDLQVRLVWLEDVSQRTLEPEYSEPGDRTAFADGFPLLLANVASLDGLNGWLLESGSPEGPLPMTRFRPNVVVSGAPAFAEDEWLGGRIRIGAVTFRAAKPCGRCVVTTTDQETGVRGQEPLRTLARHRAVGQKLLFGVNLIPDNTGSIALGDPVEVLAPERDARVTARIRARAAQFVSHEDVTHEAGIL